MIDRDAAGPVGGAGDTPEDVRRPPMACHIIDMTCREMRIPRHVLLGPSRRQPIARWRQASMALCRRHTRLSYPNIVRMHGRRDHTTAISAVRRAAELRETDPRIDALFLQAARLWPVLRPEVGGGPRS